MSTSNENEVKIVVTGTDWMGGGIGSVESTLAELFKKATNEIYISAFSIGNSSDVLFVWVEKALLRGIRIKIVINRLNEQPAEVVSKLTNLANEFPYLSIFDFPASEGVDLHAKIIVADHNRALVGSSNLSKRGIFTNYEMGILIDGPLAATVANKINKLFEISNRIRN